MEFLSIVPHIFLLRNREREREISMQSKANKRFIQSFLFMKVDADKMQLWADPHWLTSPGLAEATLLTTSSSVVGSATHVFQCSRFTQI